MNVRPFALFTAALALTWVSSASAASISRDNDSVTFVEKTKDGELEINFRKCMANNLFTFYSVKLDGKLINSARTSDNIGPFLVKNQGWIGGNHLSDSGNTTARTVDVKISADGHFVPLGASKARVLDITVTNHLFLPDSTLFAIENVQYLVAGNSIEVIGSHQYTMPEEVTVDRYYGMQSMYEKEDAILAPGSPEYNRWIDVGSNGTKDAIKIKQKDAPCLSVFIEKSGKGYQACLMLPEDLGDHSHISPEDVVFIGNSSGKCYHKLLGNNTLHSGDATRWHGIYSWFKKPGKDSFDGHKRKPEFKYNAYIGGSPATVKIDHTGSATVSQKKVKDGKLPVPLN